MKTKPNDLISPSQEPVFSDGKFAITQSGGLTKREYFAALAMQAMADNDESLIDIASSAVSLADELIMALNRTADQEI